MSVSSRPPILRDQLDLLPHPVATQNTQSANGGIPDSLGEAATPDRPAARSRDSRLSLAVRVVTVVACVISVTSYIHFYGGGKTIAYGDSLSHLLIARRILFADTPGLGQLGGVWLPLPHILMLPLIWNDWAFYSGFAGSVVMMISYVVCTVFIYKFIFYLTYRHWAAVIGTAVFALNPNVLYMQSTPMTESLMFATMMGAVYGLLRWIQTDEGDDRHHLYLLGAGFSTLLCALTRYEGWTLAIALAGVVLYCSLTRLAPKARLVIALFVMGSVVVGGYLLVRFGFLFAVVVVPVVLFGYLGLRRVYAGNDWDETEGHLVAFGLLAVAGPLGWMIWNWAIFGSPFAFQTGHYAKPSLWVGSSEKAVHNIVISLRTYEIATVDNLTSVVALATVIGLIVMLWRRRLSAESLPALALLSMFPLFVVSLYKGQRPLHVPQYYGTFYNVRFGLVMVLPACVFIGFLASELIELLGKRLPSRRWALLRTAPAWAGCLGVAFLALSGLHSGNVVTLTEPVTLSLTPTEQHAQAAAQWLRTHDSGGLMLMESYGNENVAFESHVPIQDQVYEGSYRQWLPALADPSGHDIAWIVMRTEHDDTDQVYKQLFGSSLLDGYRLVWRDHDYLIYASPKAVSEMASLRVAGTAGLKQA